MESVPSEIYDGMQHMSEPVFECMCEIVGTSQQLAIRREAMDIGDVLDRQVKSSSGVREMISGSFREGFRLKQSDVDYMYWSNNHRVILDMSQSKYYNTDNTTLILSDSSESPPGFTLLQLLTPSRDEDIQSACTKVNDRDYISSSVYRQLTCSAILSNATEHGPCGSSSMPGGQEYDTAICFVSDFWHPSASSWINRCHSWPDPEVVDNIVRNGCHFVAIGHPLGLHEKNEWRISFSQAEFKIVYSMNHCQFLIYGLLKLFLKEVINRQSDKNNTRLCSYHMKTAIFWAIQQNTLSQCCPQNFLASFWVCFKLLLKWVYEGVCPSFFIPQNNLFSTKICGSAQHHLFRQLHKLYKNGLACLLQSSSIRFYLMLVDSNIGASIFKDKCIVISEVDFDLELFDEANRIGNTLTPDLHRCAKYLHIVEMLIGSHLRGNQVVTLQRFTSMIFQFTAFILHNKFVSTCDNKQMYIADKISCHMLKLAANFGCVSDMLYIAMYYYKTLRYREALSFIELIKIKLAQPYLMYKGHVDRKRYAEAIGGQSWSKKMRNAMARDIKLDNSICYIRELILEQQCSLQNEVPAIFIPVFVMLHFLEFLCYKCIDSTLSKAALNRLQDLVHNDQGLFVPEIFKDISWEILGICQQIAGNSQASLYSLSQSLKQYPHHEIQTATQGRRNFRMWFNIVKSLLVNK
eukprot:XP_019920179.1 PREDICTED: uncharacterized protein LOC105321661 [Crassostrea gigas]